MVTLVCPVRGCGAPLSRDERALVCPRGHRFDRARSGYHNLLQPQERRSRQPGDSAAALAARRRLFDRGHGDWLVPHLLAAFDALRLPPGTAVLDVGCGEGFYLGTLARERRIDAHGLDISAPAIDLAARRYPDPTWIVGNADRTLPYATGSFDLALALTSRVNPGELRRVLAPAAPAAHGVPAARDSGGGFLLLAVPAADDLVELRAAVLSEGRLRDRLQPALASLAFHFELVRHVTVRTRLRLDAADARDLLAATYRGARHRERRRTDRLLEPAVPATAGDMAGVTDIAPIDVTASRDLATLRPWGEPR
ncbi:MAG TPA: methyltransferase domain-containing protein [Thermoanaerobaculia bacterium]